MGLSPRPAVTRSFAFLALAALAVAGLTAARALAASDEETPAQVEKEAKAEAKNPMDHVLDSNEIHLFESIEGLQHIHLPAIPLPGGGRFQITKFMVLELIAAALVLIFYVPLARQVSDGSAPRGAWRNARESLLTFVRNEIAKPNFGEHGADKFVPFLWTLFLFILFNNLLGMFPFGGSATASIYVTLSLALIVFFVLHGSAAADMGFRHYLQTFWPHIDLHGPSGIAIKILVMGIEVMGVLVRNAVLGLRLFANMFAGHVVLATILLFIQMAANAAFGMWATVSVASVAGIVALSLLELFVAFLQAFIFTFLTALFMGIALHPSH